MEQYFSIMFEDVRHERSLLLLLSLTDPDIMKQSKYTDHEIEIIRNLALEKNIPTTNIKKARGDGFIRKTIF